METKGDWRELFSVENVPDPRIKTETVGDCNSNCREAKELVCRCKCKGKNHGARLREHVQSLDDWSQDDPAPFSPEEYLEELAVLA